MSETDTEIRRLLSPPLAARYLSVCARTLWELKRCGALPVVSIGRLVRYDVRDLDAWIERTKTGRSVPAVSDGLN